jgi:hypothetical protein
MPGAITHRLPERIRQRLPARTARMRLTALYGGLFLLCGVVLLGILYLLFTPLLYDLIAVRPRTGNRWPAAVRRPGSMTSSSGSAKPSLAACSIRADRLGRPPLAAEGRALT